ncbi:phage tail protein [Sphingomonas sp.]|uniref:phage tail protein n=1 Tax=Sphingomonas sp. TaxID=28214 RepID=UPI001B089F0E|nr:phage tail protein [Sphingomonas sp.]MBO9712969.1 phage tail protein [Sphingomonas sp.]
MATLVLTVVGGVVGGPPGAMIGAQIGNFIDREVLFKPKGRDGPRLTELGVQTSSYGTQIPKLFGTMRVAGSVIWSTDLIEHRSKSGGKGQPTTTSYSYTASFAVALSARAILGVGRIWADGKLLRGSAGDFKTRCGFRLHLGGEDQAADPLIASAEGVGMAPAHRGIAYAVFEDLELGDFGNRIPSLTFEVTADADAVSAGSVLAEIGGGDLASEDGSQPLGGFAASGASVRAVAETLAGADCGWFGLEDRALVLRRGSGDGIALADLGMRAAGRTGAVGSRSIAAVDAIPRSLTLAHYDPARDYQTGVQRAARPGPGIREARLELPAAIDASGAKTIAETALARLDIERERRSLALGWDAIGIVPGARVTIAGAPGVWRVDRWSLEAMVVALDCVAVAPATMAADASGGRVLPAPDLALGETRVAAFELMPLDGSLASAPRLAVATAGTGSGWRSAALLTSMDGASWSPAGVSALPAVMGHIVVAPGAARSGLADLAGSVEVELLHEGMVLGDADDAALDAGVNLAMAGEELLQFGRAEPLGGNRWRLSRLWRGRRGTEAAAGLQAEGDRFVLVEADAVAAIELAESALGGTVSVQAQGSGDSGSDAASASVSGRSVVPPSPVHLAAERLEGGGTAVRWVRRSRIGWRWTDGADVPLGEEREAWRVTIMPEGGVARTEAVAEPLVTLSAADRAGACAVSVCQAGSHGLSLPAVLMLESLEGA